MELDLSNVVLDTPPQKGETSTKITSGPLVFDLETVPDASRLELFDDLELLPKMPEILPRIMPEIMQDPHDFVAFNIGLAKDALAKATPPIEWLDAVADLESTSDKPRKGMLDLLQSVAARHTAKETITAERNKVMATTPEMCRIVAIGYGNHGNIDAVSSVEKHDQISDEMLDSGALILLDDFWRRVANHGGPLVGYNILGFDLPVIYARSAILGVEPTRQFDLRPWGTDCVDLMAARFPRAKAMKLKSLARLYGIDVPAGDTDGSQVLEMAGSDPEKLLEYVESDVRITMQLHRKWKGTFC